jgi:hypothetical protein
MRRRPFKGFDVSYIPCIPSIYETVEGGILNLDSSNIHLAGCTILIALSEK